jgi:NAD(P)-dependent dehydrogenase (short-subunit alcohol dehydrogenase family)
MGRVDGKRAILTGAASGIGRATAELFAREGAHVVIADLNETAAKEVAAAIRDEGGQADAQPVDIGDPASVVEMVAASVRVLGGLDILFNNAADTSVATMERDGALVDMDVEVWDHCMNVDLRGAMLCAKYAIPHLIEAGGGAIVNTSSNLSLAGITARPPTRPPRPGSTR